MTRRALMALVLARSSARAKAVRHLLAAQSDDGGWKSETYGLLRRGESLTPLVLTALLESGETVPRAAVDRAVAFVRARIDKEGALGRSDPFAVDYPNYATSLGVHALIRAGADGWRPMLAYLRGQQFTEANGWTRDDACYGGWGVGGDVRRPPHPGHVDLSMTRYALEAFQAAGAAASDPALGKAAVFVNRLRNSDGGYCFSTVVEDANKAGSGVSYGSATCDAWRALRIVGAPADSARGWLLRRHRADSVAGFESHPDKRWTRGLFFYYAAGYPFPDKGLAARLADEQRSDGSWRNSEPLVKEDDPLIATALALRALSQGQAL